MNARQLDFERAGMREEIDLGGLKAALGSRARFITTSTLLAGLAALLFCLAVKPSYLAEARILVENQENYFTRSAPEGAMAGEAAQALDTEAVNSQIQLLTSRDLARKAVEKLNLPGNPEFDPAASGLALLAHPLALLGLGAGPASEPSDDRLLSKFIDHLTVMSPSKTRVLQVEFSAHDPDLAARGANAVAEIYIDMKSQAKREDALQAAQALKPLIAALEKRVAEADAQVEAFRARTGLYENSENATVPTQLLGEIASKLADARAAQSEAEAKANSLRDLLQQGRLADAGDISSNDLVRRIAEQRVAARSQLAVESRTLLPAHPRIKELQAQMTDLDAQLRAAVEKAARGFDNDAQVAGARVANLASLLEEQKNAVAVANADAAKLREKQRDAKILKDQLASLAAKYQAALARGDADSAPADARIISRALSPSQPSFPKKVPIVLFGTLAGLFFSAAYVVARGLAGGGGPAEPAPAAPAPVEVADPLPISKLKRAVDGFGAAPRVKENKPEPVERSAADFAAPPATAETASARARARDAASRAVVERIVATAARGGSKVLVVSDAHSSFVCASLTLARALAREGRAILVQIDDKDAALSEALAGAEGVDHGVLQPGLSQLLCGEASFAETIYRDGASRLHIVQSGGAVETDSPDLDLVLDALQATYDFVLVASGAGRAAERIAPDAELTVIYAEDGSSRDFLRDDFAAAGARSILAAGRDSIGEIVEMAA
jgi:uncharacterized protein involved in exopolysaccharide biosynthesis